MSSLNTPVITTSLTNSPLVQRAMPLKYEQNIENELKKYLETEGSENVVIKPIQASIEDCFIKLLK